jgi:uncharacterized protein YlxP (DUF503 family)
MVVGALKIVLVIHDNRSLKGKRKVVRSIVDRIKHRFNVAIAEVGANDLWQRIEIGVCTIGNDRRHVDASLTNVLSFVESLQLAQIVDSQLEILNV